MINCHTKNFVLDVLRILESEDFHGSIGFVDKDFDDFINIDYGIENLIRTDETDVEVMIICSPALTNLLREYGNELKISAIEEAYGRPISEIIFESAARVGALRLISKLENMNLSFNDMRFHFVDNVSMEIDIEGTVRHVLARSANNGEPNLERICREVERLVRQNDKSKHICNGHDCVRVLGRAIRHRLGSDNSFDSNDRARSLGKVLRLAYELAFFACTEAYRQLRKWERDTGYVIFK